MRKSYKNGIQAIQLNAIKLIIAISIIFVASCGTIKPYQPEIQQGNLIDQSDVKELKLGMSKDEVKAIIGSPILSNTFDTNHWNYVYTKQINGGKIEQTQLKLEFDDDKLMSVK